MKAKLAGVALALAATGAFAQSSVTLWGRMDLGYEHVDLGGASRSGIDNGNYGTSRFGLRGVEDLGGGLAAIFAMEAGISANTGVVGGGGKFFNRGSTVGLRSSSVGSVELGRQYVPIFWPFLWADDSSRWRLSPYSAVQSVQRGSFARVASAAAPVTTAGTLDSISGGIYSAGITSAFEDDLVVYKSPSFGGLSGSLAYGFGAQNPSNSAAPKDGRVLGGIAEFRQNWGYAGVGFNRKQGSVVGGVTQELREEIVSGMFNVTKAFHLWGNIHPWKLTSGTDLEGRDWMVGVSYWMPSGMFWVNYASKKIDNCPSCGTKGLGAGYHYFMSSRTELYVQYAKVNNDANAATSFNGFNPTAPGRDLSAYSVGIGHSF